MTSNKTWSTGYALLVAAAAGCGGFSGAPHVPADAEAGDSSASGSDGSRDGGDDVGSLDAGDAAPCKVTSSPHRVAMGTTWGCALRSDHGAECWGTPIPATNQVTNPPAPMLTTISAETQWACGLSLSGGIPQCWGDLPSVTFPTEPSVDVSVGEVHGCVLTACGDVGCWGGGPTLDNPPAYRFSRISVGSYFACGIVLGDGELQCWGANDVGQSSPPSGSFIDVSAGKYHACALATDDTVQCWGATGTVGPADAGPDAGESVDFGQTTPPAGTFRSVSAGWVHTCGIREDGTVACWGAGTTNVDCTNTFSCGQSIPPPGTFQEVRAGFTNTCGILTTGGLACWGSNTGGRSTPPTDFQ